MLSEVAGSELIQHQIASLLLRKGRGGLSSDAVQVVISRFEEEVSWICNDTGLNGVDQYAYEGAHQEQLANTAVLLGLQGLERHNAEQSWILGSVLSRLPGTADAAVAGGIVANSVERGRLLPQEAVLAILAQARHEFKSTKNKGAK
jgi:hypothetical protein